jgi:hypothetical protein
MKVGMHRVAWPALAIAVWGAGCSASSSGAEAPETTSPLSRDAGVATSDAGEGGEAGSLADGCPVNSGYPGDSMCLPPPSPAEGFQLHYGPPDYTSASNRQPFLLPPDQESVDCYFEKTPNTEDRYVGAFDFSMRPGSHHLLVNLTQPEPDGFALCGLTDNATAGLGGSQTPTVDSRTNPAPENVGLAMKVPANAQAVINFHVIDTGIAPLLREAWLNYYYIDASEVKGLLGGVGLTGGIGFQIQPGTHASYTYSCSPDRPVRVLSLASHMHEHALRMTAWKVTNGQATLVYQSFDWAQPPSYRYDSVTTNPTTDLATSTPGAISGPLVITPSDAIQWQCEIDNTGSTVLTFRNEALTGEMCLLTGEEVPADDPMNPYDFSCARN